MDVRGYDLGSSPDRMIEVAEHQFALAGEIAGGGKAAALTYAKAWLEHHRPNHWANVSLLERTFVEARLAGRVDRNAKLILQQGRGWFLHQTRTGDPTMLVVASLVFDDPGEPECFMPLVEVNADPMSFGLRLGSSEPSARS
jgi:hypothetical protein